MPPRSYWTGQLRLSLVSIPVRMYPATSTAKRIEFHQIHEPTGERIRYQKVAPSVGEVDSDEITKGYEYERGKYVLIDQKEIDDLKLEAKQTIDLARFVDAEEIDPRYFEKPYYLLPDGDLSEEGYAVIRDALGKSGKIGIGQFILRGQSNLVAVKPLGDGLLLEILRYPHEVRDAGKFFDEIEDVTVDKEALELAVELIQRKAGKFEPDMFKDEYNEAVWELIHAKLEDRAPEIVTAEPGGAKIINIMDALKKSVAENKSRKTTSVSAKAARLSGKAPREAKPKARTVKAPARKPARKSA